MSINNLPRLPQMNRTSTTTSWGKCACGCGAGTQSTFAPGHDARAKGVIARIVRGVVTEQWIEENLGTAVLTATLKLMEDKARMTRWNLTNEIAAYKAAIAKAESEVA